jgi:hypothetical protein
VGCSSPQASTKNHTTKKTTKSTNPTIQIENVQVTKNDGNELDLTATAVNSTNKAIFNTFITASITISELVHFPSQVYFHSILL